MLLYRFEYDVALAYLLEIGERYVRIWKDGALLCRAGVPIVLSTPYAAADLHRLRFVQSVDVLYICSGVFPVMQLERFSEADWRFSEVLWSYPPFGDVNPDEEATISPSAAVGDVTLTAARDVFSSADVGDLMKFSQYVNGDTVTMEAEGSEESRPVAVGKTWKVITHGSWSGKVTVQHSADDGASWVDLRTYSGRDDYNPTESGDVDAYSLLRIRAGITKGRCYVSLSSFPYRHEGYVRLTGVTDARHASAHVVRRLGGTEATADWFRGAWSKVNGYPRCAAFFQDRLCFGGNARYPQRLWMSRSGDYEDFSVDKEQGAVTDDSAVSVDLLSRQAYSITHMDVGNDLLVFTDGNTWSISGSETVKPSNVTPKNQEGYEASDVPPLRVGNRVVYVQRRGAMIRDTGYSYESDGNVGADLTLLRELRAPDLRELAAAVHVSGSVEREVYDSVFLSEECFAAYDRTGLVAIWGHRAVAGTPGRLIWCLGTERVARNRYAFALESRRILSDWANRFGLLYNAVGAFNVDALRWLNFAGSAMDILSSGDDAYRQDAMNLLMNQRNDNYASRVSESNYVNEANRANAAAANVRRSARLGGLATILGTAASVYGAAQPWKNAGSARSPMQAGVLPRDMGYGTSAFYNSKSGYSFGTDYFARNPSFASFGKGLSNYDPRRRW